MKKKANYVLITAARNEEAYIEKTIKSVVSQTILPKRWVIVSDGSTDCTDIIVKKYLKSYDFIQLLRKENDSSRNFASKVYAIRAGIEHLSDIEYDFIGNLDADISFQKNYYERILTKFRENPRLGIAGGILFEAFRGKWIRQFTSTRWSVSGPIQMFRRQCYEDICGYIPLKLGGEDTFAEVMARMRGWEIKTFPDIKVFHHRRTGTENSNILSARFIQGVREYSSGNHLLFEMAKCISRVREKPYLLGSLLRAIGYFYAFIRKEPKVVSNNIICYTRHEQIERLIAIFRGRKSR